MSELRCLDDLTAADRTHLYTHMGRCAERLRQQCPDGQVIVNTDDWGGLVGMVVEASVSKGQDEQRRTYGTTWLVSTFMGEPDENFAIFAYKARRYIDGDRSVTE